jgi:hypothetical protein
MNYSILSGPALAISPSSSRYYALMNTDDHSFIGSLEVNKSTQVYALHLNSDLKSADDLGSLMSFLVALAKQYKGQEITVTDSDAVVLAMALSANVASTDSQIVAGWTSLEFTLDAVSSAVQAGINTPVRLRFVGTSLQGIKQITTASNITLSIKAK